MNKAQFQPQTDEKGKPIKCIESYNQGVMSTTPTLNPSEYELISESIHYYTNSLNDGKGVPIVNTYAGKLLAYLEDFIVEEKEQ